MYQTSRNFIFAHILKDSFLCRTHYIFLVKLIVKKVSKHVDK
jgi:hypothetical protein